jgi:hypothetical protein
MFAHEAVEPAIEAAGEIKIGRVDGQDESVVGNGFVEPVGDDQLDAIGPPRLVRSCHSLIQEKRWRRPSTGCRMDVDTVVVAGGPAPP